MSEGQEQRCGTCQHADRKGLPNDWVHCWAPVPFWADASYSNLVKVTDGTNCDAYRQCEVRS